MADKPGSVNEASNRWPCAGSSPDRSSVLTHPASTAANQWSWNSANEKILSVEPSALVGYTSAEVGGDAASRPFR